MFTTRSGWGDVDDAQSWYGEPQHETAGGREWEDAYYGEEREDPRGEIEFIPEIEYAVDPIEFEPDDEPPSGRRMGIPVAGD